MLFRAVGNLDWEFFFDAQAVIFIRKNTRFFFEKLNGTLQYHR